MAPSTAESSNTRFFVLLALGVIATIAWYAWRSDGGRALSSWMTDVSGELIFIVSIVSFAVFNYTYASKTARKRSVGSVDEYINDRHDEQPVQPVSQRTWNDMTVRERAQILGWVALILGFAFYPIGSIIGLIIIRKYKSSDSAVITTARVLLVLSLAFGVIAFGPLLWFALNP